MASNTVEQIFVELLLNAKGYNKDADEAVKKSEKLEKGLGNTEKQSVKTNKSFDGLVGGLRKTVKGVAGLTAVIAAGTGLLKLAEEARKANDELNFLSKNLGMSSGEVKAWQGAAAAMGGSAQGMAGDMKGLNSSMNDFAMTGESSMLPMFNTLGVSMVDAQGKVRGTNDVMLDLADSMSKMDREQAFLMGQKLGFDEGTINTLLQGRDAMQEMVDYHKQMYTSNKQELEASRKLSENQAKLGAHWDSMKLMMGNAIIPLLVKLSNIALRFFEFLQRHQKTVKNVFEAMGIILGALVVPLLGKALVAALLFMAPFAPFILVVAALSAAFIALYDDYKVWAEGGESLFNWGAFRDYIDNATLSTDNLKNAFKNLTKDMLENTIPTLKGYADIIKALASGNFKEAGSMAADMLGNFGRKVGDRIDDLTGNDQGSFIDSASRIFESGGTSIMNNGKHSGLGSVSAKYEGKIGSANRDVDQNGNPAGWAYGKFQFNSAKGGLQKFFSDNPSIAKQFSGLTPGSTAFNNKWKQLAKADPKGFEVAQNKSAENLWYNPARDAYKKAGFDMSNHGVQEAVFSSSIQHGGVVRNLLPLIKKQVGGDISKLSAEEQIKAIYKGRTAYHKRGASRYSSEMQDALAISRGATQAQNSMPKNQIPASIAKPASTTNSNKVDVKVSTINVNTTASTLTGTMEDAIKGLNNNNLYQFPIGLNT